MVYCCVPYCKSAGSKVGGISFHRLPANADLREKWLKAISRQGPTKGSIWQGSKRSVICSLHFESNCFSISTQTKQLLPNSVPTNFPGYPSYIMEKRQKKRKLLKKRTYEMVFPQTNENRPTLEQLPIPVLEQLGDKRHMSTSVSAQTKQLLPNSVLANFPGYPSYILEKRRKKLKLLKKRTYEMVFPQANENRPTLEQLPIPEQLGDKSYMSTSVQVDMCATKKVTGLKYLSRSIKRKNEIIAKLRVKNRRLSAQLKIKKQKSYPEKLYKSLLDASESKSMKAIFLLQQLRAYGKKKVQYTEDVLKLCVHWQNKSPRGYEFTRQMEILHLPHELTLKKYIDVSSGEAGITQDVGERLKAELLTLSAEEENVDSLIVDE